MEKNETILGYNKFEKVLIIMVPMILGAIIGWFIPMIADLALKLPVVPMEGLIITIASLNHFWVSIVATIIGVVAGIIFSFIIFNESLKVTITDKELKLAIGNQEKVINKKDISAVYVENKHLVILGRHGNEINREVLESKLETARETFCQHRYPWKKEDPFMNQYERWVLGHPGFPENINALLYAREYALKEDKKEDVKRLREELATLGVVIRDDRKAQYVRHNKENHKS